MLHFVVRDEQRFPLVSQTNNASLWCYKRTTLSFGVTNENIFQFRPYDRFLCCQVMVLLETTIKFIKLPKRPWVRNDYIPNEQRFIFLLETNNVSLCCKEWTTLLESSWCCRKQRALKWQKFLNPIAYLQSEILIFLVFVSSGDLIFFSADIT